MSYIGQTLPADTFQGFTTDSFAGDGSATTFTLSKTPFNESALLVVINNVVQKPTTNFTVSGTTLTIVGTAVASGDVIYATHIGGALPIGQAASLDLNGASDQLILDADADTTISADTDDRIDFKAGGTDTLHVGNGVVTVGTTTAFGPTGFPTGVKVNGDVLIGDFTNDSIASTLCFIKSRNTTPGSQTIVNNGDEVGSIDFRADDGDDTGYNNNVARIAVAIDAAPGTNDTAGNMTFATTADGARTATERMRIDSNGRVGIGTNSPGVFQLLVDSDNSNNGVAKFEHSNATPEGIRVVFSGAAPDNTSANFLECQDSSATRLQIQATGNVQNHDNSYGQISDERIKQNITDANSQWDDIKALKVKNFERKDDVAAYGEGKSVQIGLIAQECETVSPGLIDEQDPSAGDIKVASEFGELNEDGTIKSTTGEKVKAIKYSVLYMKAIKALQEAMAKIETLETKVKALEDA
mgnify:CR=1 FL=1